MASSELKPGIGNALLRWLAALAVIGALIGFCWWFAGVVGFRSFSFTSHLHFLAMGAAHMLHRLFELALASQGFAVGQWEPPLYRCSAWSAS